MVTTNGIRRYSAEEKGRATSRAIEVGSRVASDELGIPWGTLSCWVFKARQAANPGSAPEGPPAPEAAPTRPPVPPTPEAAPTRPPVPPAPVSSPAPVAPVPAATRPTARARVAKVYTPSQIAQALERVAAIGVRPAAKELGISRNALRDWERKVAKAARGEGPAPTSGPDPKTIEEIRDRAILVEWEKQRGLGPSQIRNQLRRAGTKVSVQTVRRVMEGAGYRPPKVEPRNHTALYEAARPNQLWHMDFIHRYVHGQKVFLGVLLDDFSRFAVGWALDDAERADAVIASFHAAVARYGRPEAVMHDRGSAFWAWRGVRRFTQILGEYGVDQLVAEVPQQNGKSEVFNANLQKEFFDRVIFTDVGDLRRRIGPHLSWYNQQRTHHALGGLLVPADRYFGRVEEILARSSASSRSARTARVCIACACRIEPSASCENRRASAGPGIEGAATLMLRPGTAQGSAGTAVGGRGPGSSAPRTVRAPLPASTQHPLANNPPVASVATFRKRSGSSGATPAGARFGTEARAVGGACSAVQADVIHSASLPPAGPRVPPGGPRPRRARIHADRLGGGGRL